MRGLAFYLLGHLLGPSKSYLTPPRWRGLDNGSTPVSYHITSPLRKADDNVDPSKFRRFCSAFRHLGFGVPCWCGVDAGPSLGVGPAGLLVRALGKYLDLAGDMDQCGPQNPAYGGTEISQNRPCCLSVQEVTSDLAPCSSVQDVLAQGILDKIHHWGSVVGS